MKPLNERINSTISELLQKMQALHPCTENYQRLAKLHSWVTRLAELRDLAADGHLTATGLTAAELRIVQCYYECGTSLDMTGLWFVNVYLKQMVPQEDGTASQTRIPFNTVLTTKDQLEETLSKCRRETLMLQSPDGISQTYDVVAEAKPALDIAGTTGMKLN